MSAREKETNISPAHGADEAADVSTAGPPRAISHRISSVRDAGGRGGPVKEGQGPASDSQTGPPISRFIIAALASIALVINRLH